MKKLSLWLASIGLIVCSSVAAAGCNIFSKEEESSSTESATVQEYVELGNDLISMEIFTQHTFKVTTNVQGTIAWTTSNEAVATVENGVVTAHSVGSATITATVGGASATCVVTVTHLSSFPELTVSEPSLELVEGGESIVVEVTASYKGEVVDSAFTWTTANPSVATVVNGTVTPVGVGETTITVTTVCMGETLTKEIPVVVKIDEQIQVSVSSFDFKLAEINEGDVTTGTFTAQSYVKGSPNACTIFFASSNEEVASVTANGNEATITSVGLGSCEILAYYTSNQGKIETSVSVTVSRSEIVIEETVEFLYKGEELQLDLGALDLVGEFDGVYYNDQLVSTAEGKLTNAFLDANKGGWVNVEVHTNLAVYFLQINIDVPPPKPEIDMTIPLVSQGDDRSEMPTYSGSATELGFPEGTENVYVIEGKSFDVDENASWNNRIVLRVDPAKDYLKFSFVPSKDLTNFTIWPANSEGTHGSYSVAPGSAMPSGNAVKRMIEVLDKDGNTATAFEAGKLYTVYFNLINETNIQVSAFADVTLYVANIESVNEGEDPSAPSLEPIEAIPTYKGDVTELGFVAGTKVYVMENTIVDIDDVYVDGWNKRVTLPLTGEQDYVTFEIVANKDISGGVFHVWGPNGAPDMIQIRIETLGGAFITNMDGTVINGITAGVHYLVYVACEGLTEIQVGLIAADTLVYFANISEQNGVMEDKEPEVAAGPDVSQGENRNPMPVYEGDVTSLGFAAGTTVYEVVGPQSNASDVKLVAKVDPSGDNAYAKLDFVLSASTSSLGLWITAESTHLGYYTITPTGFTTDGHGDPNRNIFVTDVNGNRVSAFEANTMYTLYVGLDGREKTVQLTTWANLTMYIANIACVTEAEAPVDPVPPVEGKSISILFIGNSFSDDTEAYVVDILLNLGYTNIDIGNLYIGGCSIDTHYQNILKNAKAYEFRMRSHNGKKYTEYEPTTVDGKKQSIAFAIAYKDWDVISVQQASGESGKADTYANLDALVGEVKKQATNKDVEIVFNMTWAYQSDSTHAQFPDYNRDQMTMYSAIVSAVQAKVSYTVVPNGTAIQNARTSLLGDTLTRDGYHLNLYIGRFIAGLTFVAKVTGEDLTDFTYAPGTINDTQFAIAMESVQNAINNPFTITESEIQAEIVVEDPDVYAGGSNATAVSVYADDVTALGFEEGTIVYEYVGVDSGADKAAIKVDSANYDYVDVQFVIAQGDGYFFLYGLKGGNWHHGGTSYVIDPSWLRFGDNSASDRIIEVYDAQGNKVNTLMKNNVLYTLRVYTKVGELDEILISMSGSTIYFANVKQGLESELPKPPIEGPIKQGETQVSLPNYDGDETALGFEEGTYLQYMKTETVENAWGTEPNSGKTREQLAAKIPGAAGKYVTVQFAVSEDIASGSVFYVWGLLSGSHTKNGFVDFATTTHGRILDVNGKAVSTIKKNTVYILELYIEGTDTYKVANLCKTGMELYFASNSIACSDTPMGEVAPDEEERITAGGTNVGAVSKYTGDVTALGFAEGATVYQYVGADSVSDKAAIKVDSVNYDYVEFDFVIGSGDGYFFGYVLKNGSFLNNGASYVIDPSNLRLANGNAMDRVIQVFEANGERATTLMKTNTLYKMRVFIKAGNVDQVMIAKTGSTIYLANVTFGLAGELPVEGPIKQGDTQVSLPNYEGDETALGFEEGTYLQYMKTETVENAWGTEPNSGKTREQLAAKIYGEAGKYVTIKFATSEDIDSGSVFYVWGLLSGTYTQHGGLNFTDTARGRILDENGYSVTSIKKNTVYILELYIENTDTYKVSNICKTGMEVYFAADSITCSDTSMEVKTQNDSNER